MSGCREDAPPPDTGTPSPAYDLTFPTPQFSGERRLDTIRSHDLDADGRAEYVVTSMAPDRLAPSEARADLIQIYRFDTATRSYRIAASDSLYWGTDVEFTDATGDQIPDLLIWTFGGGNDPISSKGLIVYSADSAESTGAIRTVLNRSSDDPQLIDLPDVPGRGILLHALFWPPFAPHIQAVPYVDQVLAFDGTTFSASGETGYFADGGRKALERYRTLRRDNAEVSELYSAAAVTILLLERSGKRDLLRTFWDSEQKYLQGELPEEMYGELESLYSDAGNVRTASGR